MGDLKEVVGKAVGGSAISSVAEQFDLSLPERAAIGGRWKLIAIWTATAAREKILQKTPDSRESSENRRIFSVSKILRKVAECRESLRYKRKDSLEKHSFPRIFKTAALAAKDSLKSGHLWLRHKGLNGRRRLYNEPWEGPSEPMKDGFAGALQRACSMG